MAQPALSSSFTYTYIYDVFLSFRGADTRTGFTGHLYSALCQRGVLTFMDDDALCKGEEITPSLLNAIQKSRIAIVIFSKNYASSAFCLNELVHILECNTKQNMWIWPVFYDVDPSDVRHQRGSYGEAFAEHEQGRFKDDKEKVQKWRLALHQVADLSGWHYKYGKEYEHLIISKITEEVSCKLNRPLLHIAEYPVGLEARMRNVLSLMGADSDFDNKVSMLGIHGIGGIGKSTLARAIYNLIAYQFEGSCFVANVREKSTRQGLVQIQETILFQLVGEKNTKLGDVNQGIPILKERLHRKKVLLILDDVDKKEQLEATAGGLDWIGSGSVIIITTRDKHLLDFHGVEKLYEVNEFDDSEALELFRWNAFKNKQVDPSYMEIIKHAIYYAGGLPLALEIIGSNLFGKTLDEWESALKAYEKIPNRDVYEILRVSYDGLEEDVKEIFLDIACFFKGCTMRYVTNMLHARGFHPEYGIRVLEKKSLIKILSSVKHDDEISVTMHDLIQYMGKEIVRQKSTWPEKRDRLWFYEDVIYVLEKNKVNYKIEAMMLDMPDDKDVQWNQRVFRKMKNLRMLIKKNIGFYGSPKHLPDSLRVLEWWGYPAASLPSNFHFKNLVVLNLSHSCFQWDQPLEKSEVLSQLIFTGCRSIRRIPDISGFPNLTELYVDDCTNLIEIHDSVGFLDNLKRFSAKGCTKLSIVPHGIKLTSLEYLCLRDCSSVVIFPEILGPMEKLNFVDLEGAAIENLPLSMQNLKGLQTIHLNRCKMLEKHALSNIIQLFPDFFPFLKTLRLRDSNLTILPKRIEDCRFLELLDLCYCKQLRQIEGLPPRTSNFLAYNCVSLEAHSSTLNKLLSQAIDSTTRKFYILPGERVPEWFDYSSRGNSLRFWFRKEFPSITVCAILGVEANMQHPFHVNFNFYLKINDIEIPFLFDFKYILDTDHIFIFNNFTYPMNLDRGTLVSENVWSCGEVLFVIPSNNSGSSGSIKWTGVYVNKTCTTMEDVQFSDPYPPKNTHRSNQGTRNQIDIQQTSLNFGVSMDNEISSQVAPWHPPFMYSEWKQPLDSVLSTALWKNENSKSNATCHTRIEGVQYHNLYPAKNTHPCNLGTRNQIDIQQTSFNFAVSEDNEISSEVDSLSNLDWHHPFMHPEWKPPLDGVLSNALREVEQPKSYGPFSEDNEISSEVDSLSNLDWHHPLMHPEWKPPLDGVLSNALWEVEQPKSYGPYGAFLDRKLKVTCQSPSYICHWRKLTHGVIEERKQAKRLKLCGFAVSPQSSFMLAQSPFPSNDVVRQELTPGTSSTLFPTKIDPSIRSQTDQTQDDDAEMDAFYASLGAKSHVVSCSHDKSATIVLSIKAREALRRVHDFISDDALVLLHPEGFSIMKSSLEYLSNLSADDGMSRVMRALISEALGKVIQWSRDYTEATVKIETTASELHRADELEASLETNKNQFMAAVTLENKLLQKLAWMEKTKEKLEERIQAIKASISTSEIEKNIARKRKRDIFEEGKTLKTRIDESMEKAPHLQQEHGLAMETQTRIEAEWSELREKFQNMAAELDV